MVKILKLKFGHYFETDAYLRFDNLWNYNFSHIIQFFSDRVPNSDFDNFLTYKVVEEEAD